METLLQDVRYGFRMLLKNPAFSVVAVLTLALGIGANTAIFTLIDAVLLKMLPIKDPSQLVVLGDPTAVGNRSLGTPEVGIFSYPLYRELRDGSSVFSGMYAAGTDHRVVVNDATRSGPADEAAITRIVTGNYFSVLGVDSLAGRVLTPQDDQLQHAHPVAVLSYNYWKRKFALSTSVIGQTLRLNGYPFTVVGVTRPGFFGDIVGEEMDIFVPMAMQAEIMHGRDWYLDRNASWLQVMGRLKPGVSVAQAGANLNLVFNQAVAGNFGAALDPNDRRAIEKDKIDVAPGGKGLSLVRGDYEKPLLLLMAIVGLVLLIACVNVANLLLARASARSKEVAVRLAIGAAPHRIIRQLLTESILLAFVGGSVGALLAAWAVKLLIKIVNVDIGGGLDVRVLAFTAAVCMLTGILFGLVPALRAVHSRLAPALKDVPVSGSKTRSRWGWGKGLVIAQVALSLLVLFAAGLLVRSLRNLRNSDIGYNREHLLLSRLDVIGAGYEIPQIAAFTHQLLDKVSVIPGVSAVTVSENGLFSGTESADELIVPGFNFSQDEDKVVANDEVGPGYFTTVGIPLLRGREIGPQDTTASPWVAVINQSMARFFFADEDPIGRKFYVDDPNYRDRPFEIVGVVADSKQHNLRKPAERRFYRAFFQEAKRKQTLNIEVRTAGSPTAAITDLRKQIKEVAADVPVSRVQTLDALVDSSIGEQIAMAKLSGFFAVLALVLACIGLYGIMSYTVAGRTREIGVRMALGAQRADVLRLVLGEALVLVAVGIVIGVPAALASSRVLSSMLFGLKTTDPASLAIVTLTLGAVAAAASYIPARRATHVDPMVALRYE